MVTQPMPPYLHIRAVALRTSRRCWICTLPLLLWCALGLSSAAPAQTQPRVLDLNGSAVDPLQMAPGRATVFLFLRTDCPISSRYAPTIQALASRFASVNFWLVFPDKSELASDIRRYLQQFGYHLPALRDPQHDLVRLSRAQVTPEAAVFNPAGTLVYHGRIDDWYVRFGQKRAAPTTHELENALTATLHRKLPAVPSAVAVGCYITDLP